jgi:hypothetical protein
MEIDPNVLSVLLGVLANGLSALVSSAYEGAKDKFFRDDVRASNTSLAAYIREVLENTSDTFTHTGGPRLEEICLFLTSPEVEAIVRQLFAANIEENSRNSLKSIQKEFVSLFLFYFDLTGESKLADSLFLALRKGSVAVFDRAISQGILVAHEAKSNYRHRIILDELSTIEKNVNFLVSESKPSLSSIFDFEQTFLMQLADRHKSISPPYFDAAPKLPIESAYVNPKFISLASGKRSDGATIELAEFLDGAYRAVILGQPGGGKSTFAQKLVYDLATYYADRKFARRQLAPIPVILREYGAEKKRQQSSILDHIQSVVNTRYQIQAPSGALRYMLLNGRAVVIFDGLDELLDTSYRQEISSDIESFCNLYPAVPVIVTSREVGYKQAPLDEDMFETFRLSPFEEAQVKDYVEKWFSADQELTPEQQILLSQRFLKESLVAPDLRTNPLMLALMCNIYRGEHYIPKNRPDVYKKCAEMLFERWDRGRNIPVQFHFESDIRPAMAHIAFWIYSNEKLKGGVTEGHLIAKTTKYLLERRFEDSDSAERAAREFIEFCRGRAWVFTDTGTTKEGENLYQFTHATFLEYFTAVYLNRTHETVVSLAKALRPRIAKREWDVVAQLAYQIKSSESEDASDRLLSAVIDQSQTSKLRDSSWNSLSFAARCLEFILPSPKTVRFISEACLAKVFDDGLERVELRSANDDFVASEAAVEDLTAQELLAELMYPASENLITVLDTFEKRLLDRILNGSDVESILALELAGDLPVAEYRRMTRHAQDTTTSLWKDLSEKLIEYSRDRLASLLPKSMMLCCFALWRGTLDIQLLVKLHGTESLFISPASSMFSNRWWTSPAEALCSSLLRPHDIRLADRQAKLRSIGKILLKIPPPWASLTPTQPSYGSGLPHSLLAVNENQAEPKEIPLDPDTIFGFFILIATMLEMEIGNNNFLNALEGSNFTIVQFVRSSLLARYKSQYEKGVDTELERAKFSKHQRAMILNWINRKVTFVRS